MKIAILGTRGVPNNYGGFEQFAEFLSVGLVNKGHEVTVYNSHTHPYQESIWKGVTIKHIYDPEKKIGTMGQFVYDFLSILDTRKKQFDIIFQLGYTSSSVFYKLHASSALLVTNMDGLEWKRTKYSKKVQRFLLWAESLAIKQSDYLVSDSVGIQNYVQNKYDEESTYIPYGSELYNDTNISVLKEYKLEPYKYNMLIARLEPENSIEIILDGVVEANTEIPFLVVGNHQTSFGDYLQKKYQGFKNIFFMGAIYKQEVLHNLRYFSNLYFHGHTVGGTNPSLLEAMGSNALICAHNNEFNKSILEEDAFYFEDKDMVAKLLKTLDKSKYESKLENNAKKIRETFSWDKIINEYETFFKNIMKKQTA